MIYRFLLLSDEVENYKRDIQIDADSTFLDLHKIIMKCNGYVESEMTSFFMCDERWRKKQEISLVEKDTDSDVDVFVMEDEVLLDWLDEEKQRLIFVFDYFKERAFYIELTEMILGKNLAKPICNNKQGEAPPQFIEYQKEIEVVKPTVANIPIVDEDDEEEEIDDEVFYGDEDFDPEELDAEGFDDLEGFNESNEGEDIEEEISEDTEDQF